MKKHILSSAALLMAMAAPMAQANLVADFPMEITGGNVVNTVTGSKYRVLGHFPAESVAGVNGNAVRFDGYTSHISATIGQAIPQGATTATISAWIALPQYPVVEADKATANRSPILGTLNSSTVTGYGFAVGPDGKWGFQLYAAGALVEVTATGTLPTYQWNNITAVIDTSARNITLYLNGQQVGKARCTNTPDWGTNPFVIGRGQQQNYLGPFLLNSFNGIIDDVKIWDEAIPAATVATWTTTLTPDLNVPASRFAGDLLRPQFHGMPQAAWTNECHGMIYHGGKFHLFFQKNGDGPYMARLHVGHLTSENLFDWSEERIAVAPGNAYDLKGCWSGCVFADQEITGGTPNLLYTAVDYTKASIAGAAPADNSLSVWEKYAGNPVIPNRPAGLSDDFRDPYFFRNGANAYIMVGTSKNGIGATTLHRYNPSTKTWSNDGATFFCGKSAAVDGNFWEMPNVTLMPDGKWIFTVTPLNTTMGTRAVYYTGTVNADGTFAPASNFSTAKGIDLGAKQGFGMLSPTVYNHDGTVIALGIVPDKLSSQDNWNLGWAHCYSLPRQWSLNSRGELIQTPYSGLQEMRSNVKYERSNFSLSSSQDLDLSPVNGRAAEMVATFTVGTDPVGFKVFANDNGEGLIYYDPAEVAVVADFSDLNRLVNDNGVYNGVYTMPLNEVPQKGDDFKLHVFIDHSIVDIFINDRYATSIRVFPTDADADGISLYTEGTATIKSLAAYTLAHSAQAGIENVVDDGSLIIPAGPYDIYDLSGRLIIGGISPDTSVASLPLPTGLYLTSDGRKITR